MGLGEGAGITGVIVLFVLIIASPLLIYHFLIAPNIDGFFNDLDFYQADENSAHFLYWFFFWGIAWGAFGTATRIVKQG